MSYASRFFQSVGATSVHASAERLTSIANAVNGRKALRHAFESARYGERNATMLYPYQRETLKSLKNRIGVERITPEPITSISGVNVRESYMPKRRNQHSKPYTVIAFMAGTCDVMFHRGNPEKVDSMTLAKFIETVKL